MALAERYSRPMLKWVCTKCLDLTRGDQLLLAQIVPERECFASAQQRKNYNTVLSRIEATATGDPGGGRGAAGSAAPTCWPHLPTPAATHAQQPGR
ncbi:hypothetical protein HaLaN_14510, partial [Haematococcus lacustris]